MGRCLCILLSVPHFNWRRQPHVLTPYHAEVIIGFNPPSYTFMDGMGAVSLILEISDLPGDLESDIEVTVNLIDGTNAGKRLL